MNYLRLIANNAAKIGGGISVGEAYSTACSGQGKCFFESIKLYFCTSCASEVNTKNTFIQNNTANLGRSIYGGLLDRCLQTAPTEVEGVNGIEYIKQTVMFSHEASISSDPVKVVLCDKTSNVTAKKGEAFKIRVKALDQVGHPVNATIHSTVITNSSLSRLKEGQTERRIGNECTELEYNVFSEDNFAQVELYAEGPCVDLGPSKQVISVTFLPCTCPFGLESTNQSVIECICDCHPELQRYHVNTCSSINGSIQLQTNIWIGVSNLSNETGFIIHNCPFDYCVKKPMNISLSSSHEIDKQCEYNRSGLLCGECSEGLSLVFSSSKCKECTNTYLLLLIPFSLAGILLVIFILVINITVATGSIYGLVFYANMIAANKPLFFSGSNFLTVFVSWLNLDLGIETCFYDGITSQAKVLLQLVFPTYLFALILLIIILSKYVDLFAKLLSNRNPVATLCTLILLSYSKLLRFPIAALQFTVLNYPDGVDKTVWLYDANVTYFSTSHIPRFIAAAIILVVCVLFTMLLFLGRWLPRFSNWKVMKWTTNTKYIGFMDAFHAPFSPKQRYWAGLLLFALITQNIVSAMASGTFLPVLSVSCIAFGLALVKLLHGRIYKTWTNDAVDSLFLLNIGILSCGTLYIRITNILANGTFDFDKSASSQTALSNTSMAVAFFLFVLISGFHFYKYLLQGRGCFKKRDNILVQNPLNAFRTRHSRLDSELESIFDKNEVIDNYANQGPHENDVNLESDPDRYITPPIIRPATRPDQLREPALDILAPVTEEDYQLAAPLPRPRRRAECTKTFCDIHPL